MIGALCEMRRGVRRGLAWVNRRRSLVAVVHGAREVLPGDRSFGDPMSTAGTSPAHALGRQAWRLQEGRLSLLAELTLAGLQLADWLGEDVRGIAAADWQSILFTDLRGFSHWALHSQDAHVAELLRRVDAVITEISETRDGVVVKRLGDGVMAIFDDCPSAVEAAFEAIAAVGQLSVDAYRPLLRAGIHRGRPYRIGHDYVGVDVNIAARLCEAAPGGGALVSSRVREELGEDWLAAAAPDVRLRGVPEYVSMYLAQPRDPHHPWQRLDRTERPTGSRGLGATTSR